MGSESVPGDDASTTPDDRVELARTRALCHSVLTLVQVDGSAITLMATTGARELVYATDPIAQLLDELQFTLGEGPCVDAFGSGLPVSCPDVSDETHTTAWPTFAGEAARHVRGIYAYPLAAGGSTFGVLELYSNTPGTLEGRRSELADVIAQAIAAALIEELPLIGVGSEDASSRVTSFARRNVNLAAGMIAMQAGIPVSDAVSRLRARAFADQRSVDELAADVVTRRIIFDTEE